MLFHLHPVVMRVSFDFTSFVGDFFRRVRTLAREVMPIVVFLPNFAGRFLEAEVDVATAYHFIEKSFHFSSFQFF